jgi:hypothetical protein
VKKGIQMHLTRRRFVGSASGIAIAEYARMLPFTPQWSKEAGLFAFRPCDSGSLVFAVVAPHQTDCSVRIHTGPRSWTIQDGRAIDDDDARVFSGEVMWPGASAANPYHATVLERRSDFLPVGAALQVWAEVLDPGGSRVRIGSPFTTKLFASDPGLAVAYHAASPNEDRNLFSVVVYDHVAGMVASNGGVNVQRHARRLTTMLLPDVIHYRPCLPAGFNFATQNGRHPADDTTAVTETLLRGSIAWAAAPSAVKLQDRFPYFSPVS